MLQETKSTAVMQLWQKSHSGWRVLTKHMAPSYFTGSTFKLNIAGHRPTTWRGPRDSSIILPKQTLFTCDEELSKARVGFFLFYFFPVLIETLDRMRIISKYKQKWDGGNWTPASHLTGFLHTLGSVFQLSQQILKTSNHRSFSTGKKKEKQQHNIK